MQPWEQLRLRSGRAGGEDGGDSPPHPSARPQLPGAAPAEPPRPAPDSPSVSARSQSGAEAPSSSESSSEGAARAPPAGPMAPALGGAGKAQLPHFPPAPFSSSPLPPPSSPSGWGGSGASPRSRGAGRPPPGILPLAGVSAEAEKGPCGAAAGPVPRRWPGCSAAASRLPGLGLGVERGNGRRGSATIPIGLPLGVSPPPAVDRGAGAAPPPPPLAERCSPAHRRSGCCTGVAAFPQSLAAPGIACEPPKVASHVHAHTHIYTRSYMRVCSWGNRIILPFAGWFPGVAPAAAAGRGAGKPQGVCEGGHEWGRTLPLAPSGPFSTAAVAIGLLGAEEASPRRFASRAVSLCQRCLFQLWAELNRSFLRYAVGILSLCPALKKPVAQGGLQMHGREHSASSCRRPEC